MAQIKDQHVKDQVSDVVGSYHRELGQRASRAMAEKVAAGGWIGVAPTGYRNLRIGDETWIEIDPVMAPVVQEAFRLVAERGSSLQKATEVLVSRGLVSRTGRPVSTAALRKILTNPFYFGMIRYKGVLYSGKHEALVSRSLFDRVHRSLRLRCK